MVDSIQQFSTFAGTLVLIFPALPTRRFRLCPFIDGFLVDGREATKANRPPSRIQFLMRSVEA
jgi:hypothetical protein